MQFLENVNRVMSDLVQWGEVDLKNELHHVLSFHNHETLSYTIGIGWRPAYADTSPPLYTQGEVCMIMNDALRVVEL